MPDRRSPAFLTVLLATLTTLAVLMPTTADATPALAPPRVPLSVTTGVRFTVAGDAGPAGSETGTTTVVLLHAEGGRWVARATAGAASSIASGTIRYSASLALPAAGRWRLRIAHSTTSGTRYAFTSWIAGSSRSDATIWNRDGILTLPETMASRGNARQMVVVTGPRLGATHGTLRLFAFKDGDWVQRLATPARFGTNGLIDGGKRVAGTRTTPTGIWYAPAYAWGTRAAPPSGTLLPYRKIGPYSWWSSERATYNTWVESRRALNGEHLIDVPVQYQWAFSSGYNERPNTQVYGRGSGIFIHCFGKGSVLTAGCVSIAPAQMAALIAAMDPSVTRVCAIGTEQPYGATSIHTY